MPSRKAEFHCVCLSCAAAGGIDPAGKPAGCIFPLSQKHAHLARIKAERDAIDVETKDVQDMAVPDRIFALTLMDEGPNMETQPDKLWTSRHEYQDSPTTRPVFSEAALIADSIVESMSRLPAGINQPIHLALQPHNTLPTFDLGSPSQNSYERHLAKREKNRRTVKLHKVLTNLESRTAACSEKLLTTCSNTLDFQTLKSVETELSLLRSSLGKVTRCTESLDNRKRAIGKQLNQVEARLLELRALVPTLDNKVLHFNSDHHFEFPVDEYDDVAQVSMFLGVVCSVIMGVSRRFGDLIMGILSIALRLAFQRQGAASFAGAQIISGIPRTIDTVLSKFNLDGQCTVYAVCPACHCTYEPKFNLGSNIAVYPPRCSNKPNPNSNTCDEPLLQATPHNDTATTKPIKTFVYHHFHDYLAGLLSRQDIETLMDRSCDNLMSSIKDGPPSLVQDAFQAEFLRDFEGPMEGRLFVDRGTEGRYVFALNVDFFDAEGLTQRGARTSCGIISCACLNLPLDIRYKPENMYLSIIPGPREPKLTELNHYIRPLVNDFVILWERGVHFSKTATHASGRDTRCAIGPVVCDLPGARKVSQAAGIGSHFYCTVCNCYHLTTLGRIDFDAADWTPKNVTELRRHAEEWKNAPTANDQEKAFKLNGIRWSELWRLPYWNPPRQLVVDSMHCLLEGLAQFHFREVLNLTTTSANDKPDVEPAFHYPFRLLEDHEAASMSEKELKQILTIHALLTSPIDVDEPSIEKSLSHLTDKLLRSNLGPLSFVAHNVGAVPAMGHSVNTRGSTPPGRITKVRWTNALVDWRRSQPMTTETPTSLKIATPVVMKRIQDVIANTATPSWLNSVPYNFGDAVAGTLKADEWRTMTTVYLPLALISLWGDDGTFGPILDHTMALVSAVSVACLWTMTEARRSAFRRCMAMWVSGLQKIHTGSNNRVNGHMALHIYDFLRLFGPVRSWWCFPFERLIGQLRRLPTNHMFGELEPTLLKSYIHASKLRQWIGRRDCPDFIKECKTVFDKAFATEKSSANVDAPLPPSAFGPVPPELCGLGKDREIALRARHQVDGIVFARSSTHLGNSLVLFYPGGDTCLAPIPGSIKYIVSPVSGKGPFYVVQRQLAASPNIVDLFSRYPYFKAKMYSSEMGVDLEVVHVDWVVCHYAQWEVTQEHAVVLDLSRV